LATDPAVLPSTPANILYTSGTTGLPKGALLSHHHCHQILERTAGAFRLGVDDTLISVLPLFHGAGRYMNVGACLLSGARCGWVRQFSVTNFWEQARAFDATAMHILVSIAHFLIAQEPYPDASNHRITRGLIGPCPPAVGDEFKKRFGIEGFEAYASTESNISVFNLDGPKGACGRPYAPYRIRIVDENDVEVPVGETGEIVVFSDEPWSLFSGYWNQPEVSFQTMRNGGMHTGDAGYFDDDGYLWFVNRVKDMIRRRGENVAAATVEEAIIEIEPVAEAAAYPLPSEYGEDEIAVAITLKPGTELTAADVVEHCARSLPRFAVPRYIRFMDQMPMTETGKLQKFKLKELGTDGADDMGERRR
jgi:crotonobetaine/carnitine-CoA ligase